MIESLVLFRIKPASTSESFDIVGTLPLAAVAAVSLRFGDDLFGSVVLGEDKLTPRRFGTTRTLSFITGSLISFSALILTAISGGSEDFSSLSFSALYRLSPFIRVAVI